MLTLNRNNLSELFTTLKEDLQDKRNITKFAKESGINRVNLYGILKNQHRPSADTLLDLLNTAGYEVILQHKGFIPHTDESLIKLIKNLRG